MYDFIEGKVEKINPSFITINAAGIGYYINISLNTFEQIKTLGQVKLNVHLIVAEDHHTLYGFATESERALFRKLISVSGVGSSTARMMLSSLNENEIFNAIITKNASLLQSIKGIGPKAAQRIILELSDKMTKSNGNETVLIGLANHHQDAIEALLALGFSRLIAEKALSGVSKNFGTDLSAEEMVKNAFKFL